MLWVFAHLERSLKCFTWRKEACGGHNFLPLRYSSTCQRSALVAMSCLPWNICVASPGLLVHGGSRGSWRILIMSDFLMKRFCVSECYIKGRPRTKCDSIGPLKHNVASDWLLPVTFYKSETHMSDLGREIWLISTESELLLISCPATVLVLASTGLSSLQPLKG